MIHMIGNAHLDPVWLWQKREGLAEIISTMRSALDRIEENGEFIFTCSSAAYYEYVKMHDPAMFERIKKAVKEGRWNIVGGWYVQPDNLIPGGETYARHALYSQRFYKENFGVYCKTGYCVDSFGHNGNLPQLLVQGGMENYVFLRPESHENPSLPPLFYWTAVDGSKVLTFKITAGHYASYNETMTAEKIAEIEKYSKEQNFNHDLMCFYGVGNHGGGPTRKMLQKIDELKENGADIRYSCPDEYFDTVRADGNDIPERKGDLHMHAIGCYAVTARIKQSERLAEQLLLKAEKLDYMSHRLLGTPLSTERLRNAYKKVLFNTFHDIICGCCIKDSMDAAVTDYNYAIATARDVIDNSVVNISKRIDTWTEGVDTVGKIQDFFIWEQQDFGVPIVIFNTESYEVTRTIRVSHRFKGCLNEKGEAVPLQYVFDRYINGWDDRGTVFSATVPPYGYATYWLYRNKETVCKNTPPDVAVNTKRMENDRLIVRFDEARGCVLSIVNKKTGTEYIGGESLAPYVITDDSDTWSHRVRTFPMRNKRSFTVEEVSVVESGPVLGTLRFKYRLNDTVCIQDFTLQNGEDVLRANVKVIYHEKNSIMRIPVQVKGGECFGGDIPYGYIDKIADGSENVVTTYGVLRDKEGKGIALIPNDKPSFSVTDGEMAFIAVRNSIYASHGSIEFNNSEYDYTDEGLHTFSYAVYAFDKAENADIRKVANTLQSAEYLIDSYHHGPLGRKESMLSVSAKNVVAEVLKPAEDGNGTVVRLYETENRQADAELYLDGKTYTLKFRPGEVKTLLIDQQGAREVNFMEW